MTRVRRRGASVPPGPVALESPPLAWWIPPLVYAVATLILFRTFVISGDMLFGSDTLSLGYVARAFFADALRDGVFPFWNPRILGGTPFIDSLAGGDSLYPTSALLLFMEPFRALGWKLAIHVFASGLFMFGWVRTLGVARYAALVAGLAYLLAPFMVTLVFPGHDGKLFIAALTPLLFWLAEATLSRATLASYAGLGLGIGLAILTTHFQAAYFLFGSLGAYYAVRCVYMAKRQGARRALLAFGLFLGAAIAGAGVSAVQLVPAVDYVTEHSRRTQTTTEASPEAAREYASSWGLHPEEVASLVVPEFAGSNVGGAEWSSDTYWGRNFFKHNHEYAGLIVLILASLAFVGGGRPVVRWFMLALGVTAISFGLGQHTPIWRVFYEVVPGVDLFRAPSIAAFLFGFAAITLAALGLDRVLALRSLDDSDRTKILRILIGWTAALAVLALLAASGALFDLWINVLYSEIEPAKAAALELNRPFVVRGLGISTVLSGSLWAVVWALSKGRLGPTLATAAIAVLAALDVGRVDDAFIQTFDFRRWAVPDPTTRFLQERLATEEPFRVFSMVGGNGQDVKPAMYGLELAGGHHPNDLGRYRELIGMEGSGLPMRFFESPNILPLLNVRYLIWPEAQMGPLEAVQGVPHLQGLERVAEARMADGRVYTVVYRFSGLPRARLVGDVVVVPDDRIVETIAAPGFDPASQVALPEAPALPLGGGPVSGAVDWVERGVNRSVLDVDTSSPALLVVADNWFPGWQARVDGEDVPLLRANYIQQAVALTPGSHRVEIFYAASSLRVGAGLSLASLLLLVGVAAMPLVRPGRSPAPEQANAE